MIAQRASARRESGIVRHHRSTFTIRAKVFAGIKAEATHDSKATNSTPTIERAMRLSRIFDYGNAMPAGDIKDRLHIRRLAKEMHWQNRFGSGSDRRFQLGRIHGPAFPVDVHEYRAGPCIADRPGSSDKGHWRCDNLVSRAYVQASHRQMQRAGARIHAHAMLGATIGRESLFKLFCDWPLGKSR